MSDWITPLQAAEAMTGGDGSGVRIAVLDSGIDISHPDFAGRHLCEDWIVEPVSHEAFVPGHGSDLYGHGTAVAGIIWRLAPKAEIASFRVLGPQLSARSRQVSLAAERAVESKYQILNCSFACGIFGHMPLYKSWVDRAFLNDVHVVAASGSPIALEWPAHFSSVLGVDVCASGQTRLTSTSESLVEFGAPVADCTVPWVGGGYRTMTGSSFAAAWMTGMLARLLSVYPLSDPQQVKSLLRRVAREGLLPEGI